MHDEAKRLIEKTRHQYMIFLVKSILKGLI